MPSYKLIGNRILSRFQNAMTGMSLSEWHSGYRAFSVAALAHVPFEANSDGFDFDTEASSVSAGDRIVEVAIPTYYGDESYVDGLRCPRRGVRRRALPPRPHRLRHAAAGHRAAGVRVEARPGLEPRPAAGDPARPVARTGARPRLRLGRLGAELKARGHHVVVDVHETTPRSASTTSSSPTSSRAFHWPSTSTALRHRRRRRAGARDPGRLLVELRPLLTDGAVVLASVPNIGHWYPRLRRFRPLRLHACGILDRTVRFFTRRSFARLAQQRVADHGHSTDRPLSSWYAAARRGDQAAPHRRLDRTTCVRGGRRCSPTSSSPSRALLSGDGLQDVHVRRLVGGIEGGDEAGDHGADQDQEDRRERQPVDDRRAWRATGRCRSAPTTIPTRAPKVDTMIASHGAASLDVCSSRQRIRPSACARTRRAPG